MKKTLQEVIGEMSRLTVEDNKAQFEFVGLDPPEQGFPFVVVAGSAAPNTHDGTTVVAMGLDNETLHNMRDQANELLGEETLRQRVLAFHAAIGQPSPTVPAVPSDARVRLRGRLVTEEFFELMRAMFGDNATLQRAEAMVNECVADHTIEPDIVELADACADLAYVVEGTNIEFGINGDEVMAEVHRANMAKVSGPMRADGKAGKPEGWTPPRVDIVLLKQGYEP